MEQEVDENNEVEVLLARWAAVQSLLDRWYERKGSLWKQLSRERFLKDLHRNTKYFHTLANMKKRKKHILELKVDVRTTQKQRRIKQDIRRYGRVAGGR